MRIIQPVSNDVA